MAEDQHAEAEAQNSPDDIDIDVDLLAQPAPEDDAKFFVDENEQPLEFFLPINLEDRDALIKLIEKHGGKLSAEPERGYYISKFAEVHRYVVDPKFITESDANGKLMNHRDYTLSPPSGIYTSNANDADTDRDNVQQLVSYLGSNEAEGSSQTGLQNVGSTTEAQESTTTAQRPIPTRPSSTDSQMLNLKTVFTPSEDQAILEAVRRNPHRRSTHKLFQEIADKIGRHTGNSVRYRYRTHLINELQYVYKTDENGNLILDADGKPIIAEDLPRTVKTKFDAKDDYELCKLVRSTLNNRAEDYETDPKDVILPGKFFDTLQASRPNHSKAAWRDRYRKFALPFGIDKYIAFYEKAISEGREPEPIRNTAGKSLYQSKKKKGIDDNIVGETLSEHNEQQRRKKRKTATAQASNEASDASNLFIAGAQDDLSALNSTQIYSSHAAAALAANNKINENPDPDEFLTEDLVTPKFFEYQPLISVVSKISEIVNRSYQSSDAETLITALYVEAGIQKKFGTFIVTSVCGDLALIPKFIEIFLKTGENPPQNIHGIWTPRDDQYLRSGDEDRLEYLRRLHGNKRIELRRQFINQDLV